MPELVGAVLITGAAKRLGAAMARAVARDGYDVAIHCHRSIGEASRDPSRPQAELRIRQAAPTVDDRLGARCPLGRGEKRQREVHVPPSPAALRIAWTIGS